MRDNCLLCGLSMSQAENLNGQHGACSDELGRRKDAGECIKCGKKSVWENNTCLTCVRYDADYLGYPSGGA